MGGLLRTSIFLLVFGAALASGQTLSSTQSLGLALASSATILTVTPSLTLLSAGSFVSFGGSTIVTTEVRTVASSTAQLVLQVSSDFSPATGPLVSAGKASYQCSASYGTPCSGQIQASVTSQTLVTSYSTGSCTGGGGSCSSSDPNTNTISFTVVDNPTYKTGLYSAGITITISTT